MRTALGIVAGIAVMLLVQACVDYASSLLFPMPAFDPWNRQEVAQALAGRPAGGLLFMLLSYFAAGLAGGYVAKLVSRAAWTAWIPSGLAALMALIIAVNYPNPAWAQFGSALAALIGGLLARHIPVPARSEPPTVEVDDHAGI